MYLLVEPNKKKIKKTQTNNPLRMLGKGISDLSHSKNMSLIFVLIIDAGLPKISIVLI